MRPKTKNKTRAVEMSGGHTFKERVMRHVIGVYTSDRYPLILAVQGAPGTGKSYQTNKILKNAGFEVVRRSSSVLSGSREGDSERMLRHIYKNTAQLLKKGSGRLPVILFEDFDLSGAVRFDKTEYTVNTQILINLFMSLSDDIETAIPDCEERIPIFMTGNDFSALHGPMRRHGRMDFFSWNPGPDETAQALTASLTGICEDPSVIAGALIRKFPNLEIASFCMAVEIVVADWKLKQVSHYPTLGRVDIRNFEYARFDEHCNNSQVLALLESTCKRLEVAENYLS